MIRERTPDDFIAINIFDPFAGDRRLELASGGVLVAEIDDRRDSWTDAGCVQNVNDNDSAECFFYREVARPNHPTMNPWWGQE